MLASVYSHSFYIAPYAQSIEKILSGKSSSGEDDAKDFFKSMIDHLIQIVGIDITDIKDSSLDILASEVIDYAGTLVFSIKKQFNQKDPQLMSSMKELYQKTNSFNQAFEDAQENVEPSQPKKPNLVLI